jgi:hypothetical protein
MVGRTWFSPEVTILLGRDRRNVNSLEQAAEILMSDRWPVQHGRMRERAAVKLIQALEGEATQDEARQAFREAAEEAGILIGDDRRPAPKRKR